MSIWGSWDAVGYDLYGRRARKVRGEVRSYALGWSNHYPDRKVERPASVEVADIPAWCVPGHEGATDDWDSRGGWLRLSVDSSEHDWHQPRKVIGEAHADVVMDEVAVRALVDDLTRWLAMPKLESPPSRPCAPRGDENGAGVGTDAGVIRSDGQEGE